MCSSLKTLNQLLVGGSANTVLEFLERKKSYSKKRVFVTAVVFCFLIV